MGSSIKIILGRILMALVLVLAETNCCASTLSRPASLTKSQLDFYCRKDACPGGVANVGCHCEGSSYGPDCASKAAQKISLDQRLKDLILREHNLKRNLIACGSIEPFEPAARMAEVTWDDELEHLAWCNVRNCAYGHDKCRNTKAFHFAGQNIAQRTACLSGSAAQGKLTPPAMKPDETINKSIGTWFQEHRNTTLGMIDRFPVNITGGPIGHFTVMVNEKVRRVGCALIAYHQQRQQTGQDPNKRTVCLVHYLVCNYSHTNFQQQKTYTKSPAPVQNCSLYSAEYSCLCSSREPLLAGS